MSYGLWVKSSWSVLETLNKNLKFFAYFYQFDVPSIKTGNISINRQSGNNKQIKCIAYKQFQNNTYKSISDFKVSLNKINALTPLPESFSIQNRKIIFLCFVFHLYIINWHNELLHQIMTALIFACDIAISMRKTKNKGYAFSKHTTHF